MKQDNLSNVSFKIKNSSKLNFNVVYVRDIYCLKSGILSLYKSDSTSNNN